MVTFPGWMGGGCCEHLTGFFPFSWSKGQKIRTPIKRGRKRKQKGIIKVLRPEKLETGTEGVGETALVQKIRGKVFTALIVTKKGQSNVSQPLKNGKTSIR